MGKHIAIRMCSITREKLPKHELVRIGLNDDKLVIDVSGKIRSRGINLKPDINILKEAIQQNLFKRVYNRVFTKEDYSKLEREFINYVENKNSSKKVIRISKSELDNIDKE